MKTRKITVVAQDPSVKFGGAILRSELTIPWERLDPGPKGSRFHIIDYDASSNTTYAPAHVDLDSDPIKTCSDEQLLADPQLHAVNVYAICMSTLTAFERALGRRIGWAFRGPQLKVVPHAFAEANAYYSRDNEGLLFGYVQTGGKNVFTCLSQDIVVHEMTHALIDALRPNYMRPSQPDQLGFHEGFADIIALLTVLTQSNVIDYSLSKISGAKGELIDKKYLDPEKGDLRKSVLLGLGEEFGSILRGRNGGALRRSINLDKKNIDMDNIEPHYRGELLVAAVLGAFMDVWHSRINKYIDSGATRINRKLVIKSGTAAASHLRTMMIRALDYVPPIHLTYSQLLTGLLTADKELYPDDEYNYREKLQNCFADYGIKPARTILAEDCYWKRDRNDFCYDNVHAEELRSDPNEAYRFIWDNREALGLDPEAYTEITSLRIITRHSVDGFDVKETIIEYLQLLDFKPDESEKYIGVQLPTDLKDQLRNIRIHGGGVIILDEFAHVKFHVYNSISDKAKQHEYFSYQHQLEREGKLWANKNIEFSDLHFNRMLT